MRFVSLSPRVGLIALVTLTLILLIGITLESVFLVVRYQSLRASL